MEGRDVEGQVSSSTLVASQPFASAPTNVESSASHDPFSFAYLAHIEPESFRTPSASSFAWEGIRANWTRKTTTQRATGGKNGALKVVGGGVVATPVALDEVVGCLVEKWKEEEGDVAD